MEQTTAALFAFRATAAIFNSLLQTEVPNSQNKDNPGFNRKKINSQFCPDTDQDA